MKVTIDSKKGLKTNLKVFVDKKTIEKKIGIRLNELSKTVNLKGFRPGKIPIDVLKKQFGKAVYGEVLEKILQETSAEAIEEKKIKAASQPKIDLKSYGEGKDLNYTIEINELPSIKLQTINNIKFLDYELNVTEAETKKKIDAISKNQNNFKDKDVNDVAENGDLLVFDYEATVENKVFEGGQGKNSQVILGKDLFIKGFDKQLLGVKKNQGKEIVVTLPENYPKKEFANKKATFKCKILNIKKPEPIKINDDFAKGLGAKDLKDLNQLVKKQIRDEYKMNLDILAKEKILKQIEELHSFEIPRNLVDQELKLITQNLKKEDLEKNKKENEKLAKKRIKLGLILNEFGEKNNLKVNEEELKNKIQNQMKLIPGQEKQIMEYYEKNPSAAASLRGSIYEEKIINLIKEKAKKTKKIISIKEAEEIIKNAHKSHVTEHSTSDAGKSKKAKKTLKSQKKIRKK